MKRQPAIMGTCAHCKSPFKTKASDPRKFCGNLCNLANLTEARTQYLANPRKCTRCEKELTWNQKNNKFCGSSCSAITTNKARTPESRNTQRTTLLATIGENNVDKIKKEKPSIPSRAKPSRVSQPKPVWSEIKYSPITGKIFNLKLSPPAGWDDPKKLATATRLATIFSFELGKATTESNILAAIEKFRSMIWDDGLSPAEIKKELNIDYSNLSVFIKDVLGIQLRGHADASNNWHNKNGSPKIGKDAYHSACQFKFNPYSILSIPGYTNLLKNGVYSFTNTSGMTRDHMVSIDYGWRNGIDPAIISHPANCEFLPMAENSKKYTSCSITTQHLLERIESRNFEYVQREIIKSPMTPETRDKISAAASNRKKYTNGVVNISITDGDTVPLGYWRGITRKPVARHT